MILPGNLNVALARWLDEAGRGGLTEAVAALSKAYKAGETSSAISLAAYVATRVPATYAANTNVTAALAKAWPEFTPNSMLDVGAGPGVASWAALEQWPSIAKITQIEQDQKFLALARRLNAESEMPTLANAEVVQGHLQGIAVDTADLVVASYVLAELPLQQMVEAAEKLWAATKQALVLVEPGTPQGFQRLAVIREHMLKRGAQVVAPCTHAAACPMAGDDWCHFKVRLARSREHMHAKGAVVPFEDEAFSYLALSRQSVPLQGARILTPPVSSKGGIAMQLCDGRGLTTETIARRNKGQYKIAKRKNWGETWT